MTINYLFWHHWNKFWWWCDIKFIFIDVPPDGIIPNFENLCAGFQLNITRHLCHRVERGMSYAALKSLIPEDRKTLVSWSTISDYYRNFFYSAHTY